MPAAPLQWMQKQVPKKPSARKQGVEGKPSRVTIMSNKVLNKAKLCRVEGLNKAKPCHVEGIARCQLEISHATSKVLNIAKLLCHVKKGIN
jgi:hypothetical protein